MTEGSIVKPLMLFILPMIGSSIFQQLYNTVDFMFVGNVLNKTAAAAVGASSTLISCVIGLFSGVAVGTSVVCAQAIGANDKKRADKVLHSSIAFGMIGGILLMILGILSAPQLLKLLNTPEAVIGEATVYIRIYFLSIPFLVFYNMCSGAMRAAGDSKTPFRILIICGLINVGGDALLLLVIPFGVSGVAIATVISQGLSAVLCVYYLSRKGNYLRLEAKKLHIDGMIMKEVLRIGLPSGIQTVIITFSNIMVQYYINDFGETAVAAFSTYYKVENLIYLPIVAFGQAMTTFAGQNSGAGQYRRIGKATVVTTIIGAGVAFCIAGLILLYPKTIFTWFMKDSGVVTAALKISLVSFPFYWIYSILEIVGGALRGMGYALSSMINIIFNLCILRVGLLSVFFLTIHTIGSLAAVYPITWAAASIGFVIIFILVIQKKIKIELESGTNE